ncbi:MAG: DUF2461 domain-containing protein [Bacteroidales bacterium]|jgi:uncharacterized protein (TIGR02453 family)|nr:DUF2461 domain-containing protein [Bacteroidales bacterium]MDD4215692.1 DUF2461 domain-containing protein [Bacteroidales bacterium]
MNDIFNFLRQLSKNNNRDWFEVHRKQYENALKYFVEIADKLIAGISSFDKGISGLNSRQCIFRIYRDTRFSKDKTPYKTNFGAFFNKSGKKVHEAGYYCHLEPGNSFLAGGIYMPDNNVLKLLRQEIYYNFDEFEKIIKASDFVEFFKRIEGDSLLLPPKNFPKEFKGMGYLKLKDYTVVHAYHPEKMNMEQFLNYCIKIFKAMKPFNDFLNQALIT